MIKTSNLTKLDQLDFYQVINDILAVFDAADTSTLGFKSLHTLLREKFGIFDDAILQDRKTGMTDQLNRLDNERDSLFVSFSYLVRAGQSMPIPAKAEAANLLSRLLEKYTSAQALPMREETAAITNLMQELEQADYKAAVAAIGAKELIELLNTKNIDFEKLYQERSQKESTYEVESAKRARLDLQEAYRRVVRGINGLIEINGIEEYKTICDQINRIANKALTAK